MVYYNAFLCTDTEFDNQTTFKDANNSFRKGLLIFINEVKKLIFNGFMNVLKIIFLLKLFLKP